MYREYIEDSISWVDILTIVGVLIVGLLPFYFGSDVITGRTEYIGLIALFACYLIVQELKKLRGTVHEMVELEDSEIKEDSGDTEDCG